MNCECDQIYLSERLRSTFYRCPSCGFPKRHVVGEQILWDGHIIFSHKSTSEYYQEKIGQMEDHRNGPADDLAAEARRIKSGQPSPDPVDTAIRQQLDFETNLIERYGGNLRLRHSSIYQVETIKMSDIGVYFSWPETIRKYVASKNLHRGIRFACFFVYVRIPNLYGGIYLSREPFFLMTGQRTSYTKKEILQFLNLSQKKYADRPLMAASILHPNSLSLEGEKNYFNIAPEWNFILIKIAQALGLNDGFEIHNYED